MKPTYEMLMAYADGELDAAGRAAVEAAAAADPQIAQQIERLRAQRGQLRAAFDPVLQEAVPDRLVRAASRRASSRRHWSAPQWALAASVLLGVMLGLMFFLRNEKPSTAQSGDRYRMAGAIGAAESSLTTLAEQTNYQRTGRYEEVERLCKAYAAKWPKAVRCFEFGRTPEGRPMLALSASRAKKGAPVLLVQGGIHAGEVDGKDAGFLALREMLEGRAAPGALDKIAFVFVPVFNVDGHERFGRWNRPNQVGPEEMGWRVTSQNLNLNRDYTKADAPEMQAMLRLLNDWDPILYVDLHVTDGAQFQHDIANLFEPIYIGDPALHPLVKKLQKDTNDSLARQGSLPLDFYPSLIDNNDPASGFDYSAYPARYSTGYWPLVNRFALLVETHSWKDYPTRVRITRNTLVTLAELMARDGGAWLEAAHAADRRARTLGGQTVALSFRNGEHKTMSDFQGYAYTREPSAISGGTALRYDPSKPQVWRIPLFDEVIPAVETKLPTGGYLIPPAHARWMAERLKVHGIEFRTLAAPIAERELEVFRAEKAVFGDKPTEGRQTVKLTGRWTTEKQSLPAGALFVPIAQPKARLVAVLLEPMGPDSYAAWGFFNAHFEQKEYMEDYVAEDVAKEMLAKDPETAAQFKARLESDPEFAKSPDARLEFFHRRHPSWDDKFNLYPVMRTPQPF